MRILCNRELWDRVNYANKATSTPCTSVDKRVQLVATSTLDDSIYPSFHKAIEFTTMPGSCPDSTELPYSKTVIVGPDVWFDTETYQVIKEDPRYKVDEAAISSLEAQLLAIEKYVANVRMILQNIKKGGING